MKSISLDEVSQMNYREAEAITVSMTIELNARKSNFHRIAYLPNDTGNDGSWLSHDPA